MRMGEASERKKSSQVGSGRVTTGGKEANAKRSRKYPICSRGRGGGKFKLRINKPFLEVPKKECFQ